MATKLYLMRDVGANLATFSFGTNNAKANTSTSGWVPRKLATAGEGASFTTSAATATVNGATNGIEVVNNSTIPFEWISEPLAADVTISGTVTFNLWMLEDNMSANAGAQCIIERVTSTGALSTILNSEKGTEFPTSIAAQNWTGSPTSTAMLRGDRIRVRVLGNDAATMVTGFTFSLHFGADTAGSDGDSWVQFNETLTFESNPSGSQLFLTDTASDVSTADVDREAWTSRGSGSVDDVTNTTAGWTAPIQVTDTAGGTTVTWWTKQLSAFTLGGKVLANVRVKASDTISNATVKVEIAICNSDGSGASVWASAASATTLTASDAAVLCYPAGDDTTVNNGQRLRIRISIDDVPGGAMVTGKTVTITYSGTSAGAAGDTYVTLQQSVTEFVAGATTLKDIIGVGVVPFAR